MSQEESKTVIGLLDAHLACVVNALIEDGKLDKTDFKTVTNASDKFLSGVQPELLAVDLNPLLKLIRPGRYNKAIKDRADTKRRTSKKRNHRNNGGREEREDAEPVQYSIPPDPESSGDLFGRVDF